MPLMVLELVKKFWPYIVIGFLVLGAFTYVKVLKAEIAHYKNKYEEEHQMVVLAQQKQANLEQQNKEITKASEETSAKYEKLWVENKTLQAEKIKRDKESRGIKLSDNVISLFNGSKQPDQTSTAPTIKADDGKASTAKDVGPSNPQPITLNDLLQVSNENDQNHYRCIEQVEEWQSFWTKYKNNVESVYAESH